MPHLFRLLNPLLAAGALARHLRAATLLALAFLAASPAPLQAQLLPAARRWSLNEDFKPSLTSPTSPDQYQNADVWSYGVGNFNVTTAAGLTVPVQTPLPGWRGENGPKGDVPFIVVNQTATAKRYRSSTVPPHSTLVSAINTRALIVTWKSPFTGFVRIDGYIQMVAPIKLLGNPATIQPLADYQVYGPTGSGDQLASGLVPPGIGAHFSQGFLKKDLDEIPVTAGQSLFFRFSSSQDGTGENQYIVDLDIEEVQIPIKTIRARSAPSSNEATKNAALDEVTDQGDPVHTIFGNYTTQATDLQVKGEMTLGGLTRTYNSAVPEDGIFGFGWDVSYDLRVRSVNLGANIDVKRGDGRVDRYDLVGGEYVAPPGLQDKLTAVVNGTGGQLISATLTTEDGSTYEFNAAGRLVSAKDRIMRQTSLTYDMNGRWTAITEPSGRRWLLAYNKLGRVISLTDPALRKVTYAYDAAGNLVSVTNPLRGVIRYTYDTAHRLLTLKDPRGVVALKNTYDANGKVIVQEDARGTQSWEYLVGQTIYTDPMGKEWTTYFDANFRVTVRIDPLGNTVGFSYRQDGLLASETDGRNGLTTYTYNAAGQKLTVTNAANETTTFTYDANGQVNSVTDPLNHTTLYAYDSFGRNTSITNPEGGVTQYAFNASGEISTITDALNRVTTFTYDSNGNRLTVIDPAGRTTAFTYDAAGNVVTAKGPLGNLTKFTYDKLNRLTSSTAADGARSRTVYDAAGNVTSEIDPLSRTTVHTYNKAGDRLSTRNAVRKTTTFTYDALAHRTSTKFPDLTLSTVTYDAVGRVISEKTPLQMTNTFVYDANNNLVETRDPLNRTFIYTYDAANRLTQVQDPSLAVTTFTYDAAGRRTAVKDALNRATSYTYDLMGRRLTETNALGKVSTFTYDLLGRLLTSSNGAGETLTYTYDAAGQVTSLSDGTSVTTYTYDADGRRTSMTDAVGQTIYTYDVVGRLLTSTNPQGTLAYKYDKAGNRTRLTADGIVTNYTYDALNRLARVTGPKVRVSYLYSPAGSLIAEAFGNGLTTKRTYDQDGRLTELKTAKGLAAPLFRATYQLDAAGQRLTESGEGGYSVTHTYDSVGRVTGSVFAGPFTDTFTYTYDAVGNRLTANEGIGVVASSYNAGNQIVTKGGVSFVYDNAGRLTGDGTNTYTYDVFGHMLKIESNGSVLASYKYDGNGNNVAETSSGGTETTYLMDTTAALPVRVAATAGGLTTKLFHGYGIIGQQDGAGVASYRHADGLGSVRLLASDKGVSNERLDFAPFGQRLGAFSDNGAFAFTGEAVTLDGKLVNLRARFYSPALGRFLTTDAFEPNFTLQSPNLYLYAANDPVNLRDPSGNWPSWGDVAAGVCNFVKGTAEGAVQVAKVVVDTTVKAAVQLGNAVGGAIQQRQPANTQVNANTQANANIGPQIGSPIVSRDGAGLTSQRMANLVAAGFSAQQIAQIVANGGGNFTDEQFAKIVANGGGNFTGDKLAQIVANGGGNIVANGGGNYRPQSCSSTGAKPVGTGNIDYARAGEIVRGVQQSTAPRASGN